MKKILFSFLILLSFTAFAQKEKEDKAENKKNKTFGEKIGDFAGNLLTAKTDALDNCALTINVINGMYDMRTKTSETKYMPEGSTEGDNAISLSFFKNGGTGLYKLKGEVFCDGKPMEYLGVGSYVIAFKEPWIGTKKITIKTETGDEAEFIVGPIPDIEINSVNNDKILPIIDLAEDMTMEYTNPEGTEGTEVNVGLLTDIMGVRAFNNFANFPAKNNKVTIPKEAFSNLTISGAMNAGQVNKGANWLCAERVKKTEKSALGPEQKPGDLPAVTIMQKSYSTWPVIVKGKQEDGILTQLNFSGKFNEDKIGFEVHKPNAQTGIPFSRASKFGLISLTLKGSLYHKETNTSSSSWTVGNTRYTQTTTTTTILEFPQLPDEHWDNMLATFYQKLTPVFKNKFNVDFVDVEKVTAASGYNTLFSDDEINTYTKIARTYKNTKRSNPRRLGEFFKTLSSSQSSETPMNKMMRELGVDGLVSAEIDLQIGADENNHVVLLPRINFSIRGIDETKGNRNGTYAEGTINFRKGIPFNGDIVRADVNSLAKVCNVDQMVACLEYVLTNLQAKEVAMGYDKIWSIGE
ncbi:MAG: hypothetical protein POELPBGB_01709 [Bacteroidia bacterium]|nr:hypothetical protein [Bacteroidia bacterium]